MTKTDTEEQPFELVRSKRRTQYPRRPPPTATCSTDLVEGKSYSNSSGTITGPSSGFAYSGPPLSLRTRKSRGKTRNGSGVGEEEEKRRGTQRACEAVDVFIKYLSSGLDHASAGERGDKEGKAFAEVVKETLEMVWPRSGGEKVEGRKGRRAVVPQRIVCLGLGSPTTSRSAQVQLALLVVLRTWLDSSLCNTLERVSRVETIPKADAVARLTNSTIGARPAEQERIQCIAYDPVFTPQDESLLHHYNIIISHPHPFHSTPNSSQPNIETFYTFIQTPTLLYMPHCDRDLYEQILSLNYPTPPPPHFPPIILLSNLLNNYSTFTSNLPTIAPTLHKLLPDFTVVLMPNWDSGKRSALVNKRTHLPEAVVSDFTRLWDKNALRELAFHWL